MRAVVLLLGLALYVGYAAAQCDKAEEISNAKLNNKKFKTCGDFKNYGQCQISRNGAEEKEICSDCCDKLKEGGGDDTTAETTAETTESTTPEDDGDGDDNGDDGDDGDGDDGGGGDCFSNDEIITTENGKVALGDVVGEEGLMVLAMDRDGKIVFSPIVFWAHTQTTNNREYYTMKLVGSENEIALTEHHLIHVVDCQNPSTRKTIFAKNVKVGDCLLAAEEGILVPRPVSEIKREMRQGLLAPLTATGSIIVNGVAASCYAEIEYELLSHYSLQWFYRVRQMMPMKFLRSMGPDMPLSSPIRYLTSTAPKMCY